MIIIFKILIIIISAIFFIYLINLWRKKSQLEIFFEKTFKHLFPGGVKQRDLEVQAILEASDSKLTEEEAQKLLLAHKMKLAIEKKKAKKLIEK